MKKLCLSLLFSLFLLNRVYAAPNNTMSVTPSATAATTITAADENSRNNAISTTYNAHSHTDISQTANTLNVGDAAAGNKQITAYNADTNKPYIKFNDTLDKWVIADDGSTVESFVVITGTSLTATSGQALTAGSTATNPTYAGMTTKGDIEYHNGATRTRLADVTSGQALTSGGTAAIPTYSGMTTAGDIEYHNGATRTRLAAGTAGTFLKANGAGEYPTWNAIFADRGDPTAYDKTVGDLTTNGNWNDLNLSSIVPAGAKAVVLRILIQDDVAGEEVSFRENGNSDVYNISQNTTQVANVYFSGTCFVPCDSNRVIEYFATNVTWASVNITVIGWFF